MLICRLLGVGSVFVFSILAILICVQLGVTVSFATASLVLASFVLRTNVAYQSMFDSITDSVLLSSALAVALLAKSLERSRALSILLIAALLAITFACKAQGASLYMAVFFFLATRPAFSISTKLLVAAILAASGIAVILLMLSIPNCWECSIASHERQPLIFSNLITEGGPALRSLWPFVLIPSLMLFSRLVRPSAFRHLLNQFRALPAPTSMMICSLAVYFPLQVLALIKHGGAAYDLEFVVILALPLVILGAYDCLRYRYAIIILASLISGLGFTQASWSAFRGYPSLAASVKAQQDYLSHNYRNAKLLFISSDYYFVRETTTCPITDIITVWHYSAAGFPTSWAIQAVESRYYDIVITDLSDSATWDTPAFLTYMNRLRAGYSAVDDPNMPPALRGRLLQRRPAKL